MVDPGEINADFICKGYRPYLWHNHQKYCNILTDHKYCAIPWSFITYLQTPLHHLKKFHDTLADPIYCTISRRLATVTCWWTLNIAQPLEVSQHTYRPYCAIIVLILMHVSDDPCGSTLTGEFSLGGSCPDGTLHCMPVRNHWEGRICIP